MNFTFHDPNFKLLVPEVSGSWNLKFETWNHCILKTLNNSNVSTQ